MKILYFRVKKQKFVGRRISHKWKMNEQDQTEMWYNGSVLSLRNGIDGESGAEYEILYDGEKSSCFVDHLLEDFKDSLSFRSSAYPHLLILLNRCTEFHEIFLDNAVLFYILSLYNVWWQGYNLMGELILVFIVSHFLAIFLHV